MKKLAIKDWAFVTLGALLIALSSNLFFAKHDLVTGGVISIGIIIKSFKQIPLWITNIFINIPLFIFAISVKGKKFGIKSLYGMIVLTIFLWITENIPTLTDNLLLTCIYGGVLSGIGVGFVFLGFGSTGGTDLLAILLKKFIPQFSIGSILATIETFIIISGAIVFGIEKSLYAIIAIYFTTKLADVIVEGVKVARSVYIITDKCDIISQEIFKKIDRGVTKIKGIGMFSKNDKAVLLCVIAPKQLPYLKNIIHDNDKNAFVFVSDTREVLGEGFGKGGI